MDNRRVPVPISLLLDPDQIPSTKVIWMALRLYPEATSVDLRAHTGLSRQTIQLGLAQIRPHKRSPGGPKAWMPRGLLAEPKVGAQAKVLYGLLQATPSFRGGGGWFTYASLCAATRLSRHTVRKALGELAGTGWIEISQASQFKPIHFRLGSPELRRSQAEAAVASRRLKRAQYVGEAIMQEYLSLLIDSDEYTDNARPGFLVNPQTGEWMELDRFYPPNVAFEFNGAQHYGATERVSQADAEAQHLRDLIKAGICLYRGIHLTIVHAEDLSLQGITRKIGRSMPLRNLAGHELLIDLLEEASLTYWASAATGGAAAK